MTELRGRLGFLEKPRSDLGAKRELWWQELHSHLPLQSPVFRLVDDAHPASADLTVELITHRYTANSREVLTSWYPGSDLDMSGDLRAEKRTKFGSVKQVYDASTMNDVRRFFEREVAEALPTARILYFT